MKFILRLRRGDSHIYVNQKGGNAKKGEIEYVKSLGIPPAYPFSMVFLNPDELLVMSYDEMGRKQYMYSKDFLEKNAIQKYKNIEVFIRNLSKIKQKVVRDLKSTQQSTFENALIIRILLSCYLRIGCNGSVSNYKHYGISTLQKKHLCFKSGNVHLKFIGKKGIENNVIIEDSKIVSSLKRLVKDKKPSESIFSNTNASDVNSYLQSVHPILSTKMIRTYGANKLLVESLSHIKKNMIPKTERQKTVLLNTHIDHVSQLLQNTRTVLKSSYIIPYLIQWFLRNPETFLETLSRKGTNEFIISIIRKNGNT